MVGETLHDAGAFLKKHWLLLLLLNTFNMALQIGLNFWSTFIAGTPRTNAALLWNVLSVSLFPLIFFWISLGIINCLQAAKQGEKFSLANLFRFFVGKKLIRSLPLGLIMVAPPIALLLFTFLAGLLGQVSILILVVAAVLYILLVLRLFLAPYLLVREPSLPIGSVIRLSFQKMKGKMWSLFWINALLIALDRLAVTLLGESLPYQLLLVLIAVFTDAFWLCFACRILDSETVSDSLSIDERLFETAQRFAATPVEAESAVVAETTEDGAIESTNDEFDESIDIEGYDSSDLHTDVLHNYQLFSNYEPMEEMTVSYTLQMESLDHFSPEMLYRAEQLPFFLQDDRQMQKLFERTSFAAKEDYLSYLDDTKTGSSHEERTINGSRFALEIQITKNVVRFCYDLQVVLNINQNP